MTSVFVATYPDQTGKCPMFMKTLEEENNLTVLHPSFDFKSERGKEIVEKMGGEPPSDKNYYRDLVMKDFWLISMADVVIYDVDRNPGSQFLAASVFHKKPVVVVSETLKSVPLYFSGAIQSIVKPEDLYVQIEMLVEQKADKSRKVSKPSKEGQVREEKFSGKASELSPKPENREGVVG